MKHIGTQTIMFDNPPTILETSSINLHFASISSLAIAKFPVWSLFPFIIFGISERKDAGSRHHFDRTECLGSPLAGRASVAVLV